MENIPQSTGRIESLYQNQMIKNMLERVSFKHKNLLSKEELSNIETKFLDTSVDYNQRLNELTIIHSYNDEQVKDYFINKPEPVSEIEEPSLEKQKVLVKTQSKPFGFN